MIERAAHRRQRPRTNSIGVRAAAWAAGPVLLALSCAPALRPPVETGKRAWRS
jgi:hypothetical protein